MSAIAIKARTIITLEGEKPAYGQALYAPLKKIDAGLILAHQGRIVALGKEKNISLPRGCQISDLGDCCLIPGVVNCHTHVDLSFLAGQTTWGRSFAVWLRSLLPLLPRGQVPVATLIAAAQKAIESLAQTGTGCLGDIAGSAQGVLPAIFQAAKNVNLTMRHFCECFGFATSSKTPWPERIQAEIVDNPELAKNASLAGHALYSTGPEILHKAHLSNIRKHNLSFSAALPPVSWHR